MSRKVMVVDDVSLNVRMLEDILKNDYIVLTAQSGEEALGYLKKITPDLILLDNTMKGMSGFDVLQSSPILSSFYLAMKMIVWKLIV